MHEGSPEGPWGRSGDLRGESGALPGPRGWARVTRWSRPGPGSSLATGPARKPPQVLPTVTSRSALDRLSGSVGAPEIRRASCGVQKGTTPTLFLSVPPEPQQLPTEGEAVSLQPPGLTGMGWGPS